MKRLTFLIAAVIVMALVGIFFRAGNDRTAPPQVVSGPATPHDTQGTYANCLNCHSNITASHDESFGAGNYSDCLRCHPQQ